MEIAPQHVRCWLMLCTQTALRHTAAREATPADYQPERRNLTLRMKGGHRNTVPVSEELHELLMSAKQIVPGDRDVPYTVLLHPRRKRSSMAWWWKKLKAEAGIETPITPHDLRRTTANEVQSASQDLRVTQRLLGHRSLKSTLHYLSGQAHADDLRKVLSTINERTPWKNS
jgi:integrase